MTSIDAAVRLAEEEVALGGLKPFGGWREVSLIDPVAADNGHHYRVNFRIGREVGGAPKAHGQGQEGHDEL